MHRPKRLKMAKPAALAMAEASAIPLESALDELGCLQRQHDCPRLKALSADAARCARRRRGGRATSCSFVAGFIRQLAAGIWTFAPLGWRVHRKVEQIIREELDAIGAQEWFAPVLTPAELWETTGRIKIPEIFHIEDRAGRDFMLPLTHEETFTFHARELQSYKQLPQAWYHFQTKDRDEPRPRGGLLRVREFIMKDSYSFDRDEEGLDKSFKAHGARTRDLRALRPRVLRGRGRVGDDGRQRVDRLSGAVGLRREHAGHVRER